MKHHVVKKNCPLQNTKMEEEGENFVVYCYTPHRLGKGETYTQHQYTTHKKRGCSTQNFAAPL